MVKEPAATVTAKATAAVTGQRFVNVSGNRTGGGPAGGLSADLANLIQVAQVGAAGANAIGVAAQDIASGAIGKVHLRGVVTVESGAALVAGQAVMSDALGRAVAYSPTGALSAASTAHALAAAFSDTEVEAALNALGSRINAEAHRLGTVMTGVGAAGAQAEILLT
jgi:hypothetical protein